jgi:subtilase family protein
VSGFSRTPGGDGLQTVSSRLSRTSQPEFNDAINHSSAKLDVKVRVAVIDSGVHAEHPHVGGIAGGIAIDENGRLHDDYVDRLGHGTAVTAAIKEKAPDAEIYAVKVFDRALSTRITSLVAAIDWAAGERMHLANLSLGTMRIEHEAILRATVERAIARDLLIVSARDEAGVRWLPGSLPGVIPVQVDWDCPRHSCRTVEIDGAIVFRTSGFPRPIDGVAPQRNLNGISFAVANLTGLAARCLSEMNGISRPALIDALRRRSG